MGEKSLSEVLRISMRSTNTLSYFCTSGEPAAQLCKCSGGYRWSSFFFALRCAWKGLEWNFGCRLNLQGPSFFHHKSEDQIFVARKSEFHSSSNEPAVHS